MRMVILARQCERGHSFALVRAAGFAPALSSRSMVAEPPKSMEAAYSSGVMPFFVDVIHIRAVLDKNARDLRPIADRGPAQWCDAIVIGLIDRRAAIEERTRCGCMPPSDDRQQGRNRKHSNEIHLCVDVIPGVAEWPKYLGVARQGRQCHAEALNSGAPSPLARRT